MGATLMTARVGKTMEDNGDFWSTYGWHPRSVCAAAATLDVFEEAGEELFPKLGEMHDPQGRGSASMTRRPSPPVAP